MIEEPKVPSSDQKVSPFTQSENRSVNATVSQNDTKLEKPSEDVSESRVNIPLETIYILLTGMCMLIFNNLVPFFHNLFLFFCVPQD